MKSNNLNKIINKKFRLVIGLLSGTSVDAVDAVLLKITGSGINSKIKILGFTTQPIPNDIRLAIFRNSNSRTGKIDEICRLNVILGALFSDAVLKLLRKYKLNSRDIDLIGSHGQTIHHLPGRESFLGYKVKSTMQIGDPSIIANLTGITTVGDFRIADCAFDGGGAPLVPYLDYILFTHNSKNRALLNIGGISNITILPAGASKEEVFAFDTGPGNMIIDGLTYHLFRKGYDKGAVFAKKGKVNLELFNYLLEDKIYSTSPPKSTGREHYGMEFQKKLLKKAKEINKYDIVRTVTEFTAFTIYYNYKNFIEPKDKISELIISGGGSENPVIMKSLRNYFKGIKVRKMNDHGITSKNKEAVLFAVLANECISGNPANMRSVSGSTKDAILGKICLCCHSRESGNLYFKSLKR
ncbi:MAG: anhydro-N-acetylmuramic acid kinase [Ignavibacteria bacterium]|nr:anhydro-N-acetylmuramic acid kinase [Ignavibacteria bacterium]